MLERRITLILKFTTKLANRGGRAHPRWGTLESPYKLHSCIPRRGRGQHNLGRVCKKESQLRYYLQAGNLVLITLSSISLWSAHRRSLDYLVEEGRLHNLANQKKNVLSAHGRLYKLHSTEINTKCKQSKPSYTTDVGGVLWVSFWAPGINVYSLQAPG